jgi:hypothetical protein
MAIVLMMQMAVDDVIDMIAMRDRFVTTAWTVDVIGRVAAAPVAGRTNVGVHVRHFQLMLFDHAVGILMMQMPVVQVIDMIGVNHRCMSACVAVDMGMLFVCF